MSWKLPRGATRRTRSTISSALRLPSRFSNELSLRVPTPQTELMFRDSFNAALDQYQHLLDDERAGLCQEAQ
jgi:hypothetical protein